VDEDPLEGRRGFGRLLAVLSWGEFVMLVAVALITITLIAYLGRALQNQPAVLTPTPKAAVAPLICNRRSRARPRRRGARGTPR
jgi:hypothetical protein